MRKRKKKGKKEEGEKNTTGANTNSHVESEQRAFGGTVGSKCDEKREDSSSGDASIEERLDGG